MVGGVMLICKQTGQARSIKGCMMWDSPHEVKKALKKDCKRCGQDYGTELLRYEIVSFIATRYDAGVVIDGKRHSLHRIKLTKDNLVLLERGKVITFRNHDIRNIITLEVDNDQEESG